MKKIHGYIMAIVGFIMLLINAIGYIFHFDFKAPVITILGLIFVVVGMTITRKNI